MLQQSLERRASLAAPAAPLRESAARARRWLGARTPRALTRPRRRAVQDLTPIASRVNWHPHFSREDATLALEGRPPYAFVIRPSSRSNAFALSFVTDERVVKHCLIHLTERGYSLDQSPVFYSNVVDLLVGFDFKLN